MRIWISEDQNANNKAFTSYPPKNVIKKLGICVLLLFWCLYTLSHLYSLLWFEEVYICCIHYYLRAWSHYSPSFLLWHAEWFSGSSLRNILSFWYKFTYMASCSFFYLMIFYLMFSSTSTVDIRMKKNSGNKIHDMLAELSGRWGCVFYHCCVAGRGLMKSDMLSLTGMTGYRNLRL